MRTSYAEFLANTLWFVTTGEEPAGAYAVEEAADWAMRALMECDECVRSLEELEVRVLSGDRPDGGAAALVPLIERALTSREFGSLGSRALRDVRRLEGAIAAADSILVSDEARGRLRTIAARYRQDPHAAWCDFKDGLADIMRGVPGLAEQLEDAWAAAALLEQMDAFDILSEEDSAEMFRLRGQLLECMAELYRKVMSTPSCHELALRYARARLRDADMIPRVESLRRYAEGEGRADTAVAVANVLWHSGVIARLRDVVERAQATGGRVWFLGRDADALYAYCHALGYSCVRYMPGIDRSMVSAYPQVVEAIARLMLRPADFVVDTGFAGTCVRPLVDPSGASGVLVSSSGCIHDLICLDDHLDDTHRRSVRDAVLIMEALHDDSGRLSWRGERASHVEIDDGVPREHWDENLLPTHSKFICDFVDELLALEGTEPDLSLCEVGGRP